jgi:hypothetical protein
MAEFAAWVGLVDKEVWRRAGLSVHDLEDAPLADWFDRGVSAKAAAGRALRWSGFGRAA